MMHFYEALKFILTTASGKVRRLSWPEGYYIMRGYKNTCMGVILISGDNKALNSPYNAATEDLVAEDWILYYDEENR